MKIRIIVEFFTNILWLWNLIEKLWNFEFCSRSFYSGKFSFFFPYPSQYIPSLTDNADIDFPRWGEEFPFSFLSPVERLIGGSLVVGPMAEQPWRRETFSKIFSKNLRELTDVKENFQKENKIFSAYLVKNILIKRNSTIIWGLGVDPHETREFLRFFFEMKGAGPLVENPWYILNFLKRPGGYCPKTRWGNSIMLTKRSYFFRISFPSWLSLLSTAIME